MFRFFYICLFVVSAQSMAQGDLYDATQFDISGVKLGMNADEAVAALTSKLGISKEDLRFDKYPMKDIVHEKKIPKYFVYEKDGVRIQVNMVAAIPVDKENPMRVNAVSYHASRNNEVMEKMREGAFKKYGMPSNGVRDNDHVSMKYSWCTYDKKIPHNSCFNAIGAQLVLSAPSLSLKDPTYLKKIQEYMSKKKASTELSF